jgi:capsular polysaccharide biosynthesis protein
VVEIPKGRIYSDNDCSVAVISADNKLIHDLSFTYSESPTVEPEKNNIFQRKYFVSPKVYKGVVFNMVFGGVCISNTGHWLTDILPRLHLLKKSGLFNKVDYFLVPSIKHDFQQDSLRMLGIPLEKVIDGESNPHITADTIIACTTPRGFDDAIPQWTIDFLRDSFLQNTYTPSQFPSRIYISRKDTSLRNVVNEDEVMELLSQYNIVSYQLSQLSFMDKVRLFAYADLIVSPTGAGLMNMYFSRPGTKVLEIFSDRFVVGPSFDIAEKIGLDYHYMFAKPTGRRRGVKEHVAVDINKLKEALDKIMTETKVHMPV